MHAEWNQWVWDVLSILPTDDERAIKRAYSVQLKISRPEDDADKFQKLRQAYDAALTLARTARESAAEPAPEQAEETARRFPAWDTPAANNSDNPDNSAPALAPSLSVAAVWQDFHRAYMASNNQSLLYRVKDELRKLAASEAFHNLDFAGAFELHAAQYCAGPDADEELRDSLVGFYAWEQDSTHLEAGYRGLGHTVLGRFRADAMYRYLKTKNDFAAVLLETKPPAYSWKLYNKKFATGLQDLLQGLRWRCPEVIWYRLNADVVQWWEQKLAKPRIYSATIIFASLLGFVLSMATFAGVAFSNHSPTSLIHTDRASFTGAIYLAGQLVSFPIALGLQFFGRNFIGRVMQFRRSVRAQLGWMPVFAVLSLPMLLHIANPFVEGVAIISLCAVVAFAMYANTTSLSLLGWLLAGLLILLSAFATTNNGNLHGSMAFWPVYIPVAIVCIRGGKYYYEGLDRGFRHLFKIRLVWMAASAIGLAAIFMHGNVLHGAPAGTPVEIAMFGWLMAISALLLVDCYFNLVRYPFFVLIVMQVITIYIHRVVVSATPYDPQILTFWITMFVYMLLNIVTMHVKKREFC